MDAKRIIPVLQVRDGQVASAEGPVPASTWARRLELEGADGILFRVGAGSGAQWIREVAGTLSIPFTLEAPLRDWAELEETLEAVTATLHVQKLNDEVLKAPGGK